MKQQRLVNTILSRTAYLLLLIFLLSGCRSTKNVVTKPNRQDMDALKSLILDEPPVRELNSKVDFWFSAREGVSTKMRGSIKLRTDSCMILSLQFSGIELARCLLRPDSLVIVSRLHSMYATESLKNLPYLSSGLYKILEQVLTNRMFIPGRKEPRERDLNAFVWQKQKEGLKLSLEQPDYALSYVMDNDQQYKQMFIKSADALGELTVNYSDFQETKSIVFPNLVEIDAKTQTTENESSTIKLKITYLKPVFNTATDFNFSVPAKYKKVTLKELFKQVDDML